MPIYPQAIYHLIPQSGGHPRASQIFLSLEPDYPALSLAAVYNNLHKLLEAGMIRKISTDGVSGQYDRAAKHNHLICNCCGKLTDICLEDSAASLRRQLGDGVQSYDLTI